jgi:hypothetical protein
LPGGFLVPEDKNLSALDLAKIRIGTYLVETLIMSIAALK